MCIGKHFLLEHSAHRFIALAGRQLNRTGAFAVHLSFSPALSVLHCHLVCTYFPSFLALQLGIVSSIISPRPTYLNCRPGYTSAWTAALFPYPP